MTTWQFDPALTTQIIGSIGTGVLTILNFAFKNHPLFSADRIRSRSKEEKVMEFLSAFLAFDIEKRSPIIVEQAFRFAMKQRTSYIEIKYLLAMSSPMHAFQLFRSAKHFVRVEGIQGQLKFIGRYGDPKYRKFASISMATLYFIFAFVGVQLATFFIPWLLKHHMPEDACVIAIASLILFGIGVFCLDRHTSIDSLESFLEECDKSTPNISTSKT